MAPLSSLAIAGAWGYIGRKFLEAANQLQLATSVYDVGPPPSDLDLRGGVPWDNERAFYHQHADVFHLALHPEHRGAGLDILLRRSQKEPIWVLCEKPIALPESPEDCVRLVEAVKKSQAIVLYDFPELFDPITDRILDFLRRHDDVRIDLLAMQRSKDRENPDIARNRKKMVHIQYQESVHCLAFALHLLAHLQDGLAPVFGRGLRVSAQSEPYHPPNPSAYSHLVDGKCEYQMALGDTQINGRTDFTRGAPWSKRRTISGRADGRQFTIEADFLEGKKWLVIDGEAQEDVVSTNSYVEVLKTLGRWRQNVSGPAITTGLYPNPTFARITYQLSSLLWRSSWEQAELEIASLADLLAFDAGFAQAKPRFAHYPTE
ncbi:MAG: Gfo/Idh/MocA family oxidoreductase [Planctomycetota bacterium]